MDFGVADGEQTPASGAAAAQGAHRGLGVRPASTAETKRPACAGLILKWCPGEDSNLHGVAPAST